MSNSNFKLIEEPINRNLVIFVNKNGDVGTDTLALQDLLSMKIKFYRALLSFM